MERTSQKIGLTNLVVLLAATLCACLVANYVHSSTAWVGSTLIAFAFLVAAITRFQLRLEDRERFEQLEVDELAKSRGSDSLFASTNADVFPARRAREQFDRFFVPAFTFILFLLQAGAVYGWSRFLAKPRAIAGDHTTVAMATFALIGLVLFLLGKYSTGIARLEGHRLLRPVGNYLLLNAYVSFVVTGTIATVQAGFPKADEYAARALCVLIALVAVENLLGLVLEIYRPRVKGNPDGCFTKAVLSASWGIRKDWSPPPRRRSIISSASKFLKPGSTAFSSARWRG
jgi:hypothetical protein